MASITSLWPLGHRVKHVSGYPGTCSMETILALDPAWTKAKPSGVALIEGTGVKWRCIALAPSYADFIGLSRRIPVVWGGTPPGGLPNVTALLSAAHILSGVPVDLVTIDMPVAMTKITGRRQADNLISKQFGAQWCSAYSPSSSCPGPISDQLRLDFDAAGYPLMTKRRRVRPVPSLVEVYPHPALLSLMKVNRRVPYKVSKMDKYWKAVPPSVRRSRVVQEWLNIAQALSPLIAHRPFLPAVAVAPTMRTAVLKQYEDALDALVCGWVGIEFLAGRCTPFGNDTAAIWVP